MFADWAALSRLEDIRFREAKFSIKAMPRTIITVIVRPVFRARALLVRLVEKDENQGYYVWKRDISTAEAEQWILSLAYQTIAIAPEIDEDRSRDGESYDFIFQNRAGKIRLSWDNEIPENWKVVESVTKRLIQIAHSQPENK